MSQATNTASQMGDHKGAQPEDKKNQVVASTPFSREEQRIPVTLSPVLNG